MAKFKIKTPDGNFSVEAPDEQSALNAMGLGGSQPAAPPAEPPARPGMLETMGSGAVETAKGLLTGGVGGLLDLPMNAINLSSRTMDAIRGTHHGDLIDPERYSAKKALETYAVGEASPTYAPAREGGELIGNMLSMNPSKLLTTNPAQIASEVYDAGKAAASFKAGQAVAEPVGGAIGDTLGTQFGIENGGERGRFLGSLVGSLAAPAVVPAAGELAARGTHSTLSRLLTKPDTPQLIRDADAIGAPVSMGYVGNKVAADLEDSMAALPIFGRHSVDSRRGQFQAEAEAAQRLANEVRAYDPATGNSPYFPMTAGPIDETSLGRSADRLTTGALDTIDRRISTLQDGIIRQLPGGQLEPVPGGSTAVTNTITNLENDPGRSSGIKGGLGPFRSRVEADVQASDAAGLSPELTYGQTKDLRSILGKQMDDGSTLSRIMQIPLYRTLTRLMAQTAESAGMPRRQFFQNQRETADLYNEQDLLDRAQKPNVGDTSFSSILNSGYLGNDVARVLANRAQPDAFRSLLGDLLEYRLRGNAASEAPTADNWRPRGAASNAWNSMSGEAKDMIMPGGTGTREDLESLSRLNAQDPKRPTRALPGRGGNTFGLPTKIVTGVGGLIGAPLLAAISPGTAALTAAGTAGLGLGLEGLSRALNSDRATRWVGNSRANNNLPMMAAEELMRAAPAVVEPQ